MYGGVSPVVRAHSPKNQGLEIEMVPFTVTTSDPLAKFLLPASATLVSVDPRKRFHLGTQQ